MNVGDKVEVYSAFAGTWARGFVVAEVGDGQYRLRRTSDGAVLPTLTGPDDVRPADPAHKDV